jgi:peptide/nickel transport system substrate-binding protein
MHSVFVSHSHQDNEVCDAFVAALQSRGVDVWYDRHDLQVGHLLSTEIQRELQARTVYILLATPAAIASYWVETELGAYRELAAHDRTRVIIPIIIAPCELPLLLRAYKWIDAVDLPLETVVDQLAPTIGFPTQAELAAEERARAAAEAAAQRRQAEEERRAERQRVALELSQARERRRARLTADLVVTALLTLALLASASLLLSLGFGVLPRTAGIGAGILAAVLLVIALGLVPPVRRGVAREWRDARRGLSAVLSVLLTLAVVLTALFVAKPTTLVVSSPKPSGYDFSYTYHTPTHLGGSVTVGLVGGIESLSLNGLGPGGTPINSPLAQSCLVQLPDLSLGLNGNGWRADQCTEVPTVDNGGESPDGRITTFHIDPRAVWSDGTPIKAEDFLFDARLLADPNVNVYGSAVWDQMTLTAPDPSTVQIRWAAPYADYLTLLAQFPPVPLHVYATGKFAGIYHPTTGAYNTAQAQQLINSPAFNTTIPVDNGPFTVQSFVPDNQVVLLKNPRFFSNYFHAPALDQVTLVSMIKDFPAALAAHQFPTTQMQTDAIDRFRQGALDLAIWLQPTNLSQLGGIPSRDVITAPGHDFTELGFNERTAAPNAQANGDVSILKDPAVRQAFVEAFDRCAAVRALLGSVRCDDPNLFTDEAEVAAPDSAYDPTFRLPSYNPSDAAKLLDGAGYPVVDNIRRNKDGRTPLQLTLVVSPGAGDGGVIAPRMQQNYQNNLHVGVSVEIVKDLGPPLISGNFDLMLEGQSSPADPVRRLTSQLGPFDSVDIIGPKNPHGWNLFGIIDPYANQRDQLAATVLADDQRTAVLRDLERYFSQQYYVEEIYVRASIWLAKPALCNLKHWPQDGSDLWNMADWYLATSTCP